jgi:hypothetical protein
MHDNTETVTNSERNPGMIRTKLGLLGLCAVVFGIMAFAASAAQAEAGSKWLILPTVNGEAKDAATLLASIGGEIEDKTATLLTSILSKKVALLCTTGTLEGIHLEKEGTLTDGGKVHFDGCIVYIDGVLNTKCKPHSAGAVDGLVASNAGKGLLVLVGGKIRTRIEPKTGETFVTINMGLECPIGELVPVRGKLFVEDAEPTKHLVRHLIKEDTTNSHLWVLNLTTEHEASIDGSAEVFLTGSHLGKEWGADA